MTEVGAAWFSQQRCEDDVDCIFVMYFWCGGQRRVSLDVAPASSHTSNGGESGAIPLVTTLPP